MNRSLRWPLGLLALAVLSACSNNAAPTAAAPEPPAAVAASAPAEADAEVRALTMDGVSAYFKAQQALALASSGDASLGDLAMNLSEEDSAQYAARLHANAKVRSIIEQAGLSAREFAFTGETLLAALMTQGAIEAGQLQSIPDGIEPASVEFVKQHKEEIEALMESMQAAGGQ